MSSDAHSPDQINARLRANEPPIIARVKNDETVLDMRTLMDGDEEKIVEAIRTCFKTTKEYVSPGSAGVSPAS